MKQSNLRTSLAFIRTIDAEKRTHLAELRTGIGILTIPMSLLTILIATSNYYSVDQVFGYILVLSAGIILLTLVGGHLVVNALRKIRADDNLKGKCDDIACLVSDFNGFDHDHD
jgi:multisubunit Na+/H+ antiporter MnhG subunit